MQKTRKKPFYKNIRVILWKNLLEKTPNIPKKGTILKIGHLAEAIPMQRLYSLCKMVGLGQKLKMPKTRKKGIVQDNYSYSVQKTGRKKKQIFEKLDYFENWLSCKGYSPCKGYCLCKMVGLSQKLKMPKTRKKPF